MSVLLLEQTKAYVRSRFTQQQVVDVTYYGGEFSSDEVGNSTYKCPAILIAGLGWRPPRGGERMAGKGTRVVSMAAFVVTSNADRQDKMLEAQRLAELLDVALRMWTPQNAPGAVVELAAVEDDIRCENVYNRKIDFKGQALWLVSWRQCIKPLIPLPELYDLLGVDIVNRVVQLGTPPTEPVGDALSVTEEINFKPST